ncbi:3-oxoacyl-(acyl carrier protein) synthase II [Hyphomicrobium denitrificans 1NES1]|uniref:3-oxoacyl-(Acyl carrier protein) synthase II n=1 Tax=Hyphomicrobium denitrificans 1NES1 TaxID=670307 RepID=N0B3G3_9HYPH|nr:beta-ketoacyl-ACP synthase [Hyphomicrobium denitrificans]AGK56757.1 3-oxoacyl-(acyl carrier protein) synthase II [Hyphomicrobium denitrificans 1NES1]
MPTQGACEQVWITGIGLVSSLGVGIDQHWTKLRGNAPPRPVIDAERFAPYPVHPLQEIDFSKQIPRTSDQRQMERWQKTGVYAAGLALEDAGIAGNDSLLDRTDLCIAAGNGERDVALDSRILATVGTGGDSGARLNTELATGLRPTLYLGQLSNLLAGNISIIHKATGSSRTFKGEEMAGVSAIKNAVDRIEAGQGNLFLVGGALNAEREDLLLACELTGSLYNGPHKSVWHRHGESAGFIPGSVGVFLVLEASNHARARGAMPYAQIAGIESDRSHRRPGDAAAAARALLEGLPLDANRRELFILSGANGTDQATAEELRFLSSLQKNGVNPVIRAWGSLFGHAMEAHFLVGVALAGLALSRSAFYPPFDDSGIERAHSTWPDQILVTTFGHWRGEGLGLVQSVW